MQIKPPDPFDGPSPEELAYLFNPKAKSAPRDLTEKIRAFNGARIGDKTKFMAAVHRDMAREVQSLSVLKWTEAGRPVCICGDGPSLIRDIPTIRKMKQKGARVVSLNKVHDKLINVFGVVPWGHVMMDPQERVADYVKSPRQDVKYMLAAGVHEQTWAKFAGAPTYLWLPYCDFPDGSQPQFEDLKRQYPTKSPVILPGGTTVGLRAVWVSYYLGMTDQHWFGFDSSFDGDARNVSGKPQADGVKDLMAELKHRDGTIRQYRTNDHMAKQVLDFEDMIGTQIPDMLKAGTLRPVPRFTIHGSGYLPDYAKKLGMHADG